MPNDPLVPPPRSATAAWVVYDLANTIFAFGIAGTYFADWMTERNIADSWLSVTQAVAGATVIFLAPWIGARSDHRRRRMPALVMTTLVAVVATALLGLGPRLATFVALAVALVGVNTGSVAYDALLPLVSTEQNRGLVSGVGVGVGYFGSFVGLALGTLTLDVLGWSHVATFRAIAVGFLVFALPTFVFVREPAIPARTGRAPGLGSVAVDLLKSWRRASEHPDLIRFLVGRFLYTDAINTLINGFLFIFATEELGLPRRGTTALLATAIAAAVFGGFGGGRLVERLGPKRVLLAALLMWVGAIASGVAAAFTGITGIVWALGPLGGFALGATWAADRVVMLRVSPPARLGEFYGLYATVGRFATILGPLVWGLVVDVLHWGRTVALGSLGLFVIAGWWVERGVDDRIREWAPELR